MNQANFVPELFIGIGETNAFFTLRETYLHEQWVGGAGGYLSREVRSFHHCNLSQDADAAVAKAEDYAERLCLKLNTNAEALKSERREIERATAEQLKAREDRLTQERAEYEAWRATQESERRAQIEEGIIPFGRFSGKTFREVPRGYINWLMDKAEEGEFEAGSLMGLIGLTAIRLCPDLRLPKPIRDLYIGTEGRREVFEAVVIRVYDFTRPGFGWNARPETCYITTLVTAEGACLITFSAAFAPAEGDTVKIKATVKKHDEYKGQAQTVLQRVKEVK